MQDRHKEHLLDSQKVLLILLPPEVFWAIAHPLSSQILGLISPFFIIPFSSDGIVIPTLLLLPFLLLWVQVILQLPHRIFSRPLPGSQRILLASMVRMQRMRMHGWPWCVITLFFMAGTAQQEVAYAATLLRDVAKEWWVGYL